MKTLKRISLFYFLSILTFIVVSKVFGGQIFNLLTKVGFWIFPLIIIVAGQVIGYVAAVIVDKPFLKHKIFNLAYFISFVVSMTVVSYNGYSDWRHDKEFGNIEANEDHFKYFGGQYATEERIAFDSLTSLLVDANSFLLAGGSVEVLDTQINSFKVPVYLTTLHYKKRNQETTFKAKFAVLRNEARLIFYDLPLDQRDKDNLDSLKQVAGENFSEAMKVAPDSIQRKIKKEFPELMKK